MRAVLTRIYAISDGRGPAGEILRREGLRRAVTSAIDYGLEAVEVGDHRPPAVPGSLLAQARAAARQGIPLETLLRRYVAGHSLFRDYVLEEGEEVLSPVDLKRLMRSQAAMFDRLLDALSEEHARGTPGAAGGPEQNRGRLIRRLLDGERIDAPDIAYDLHGNHMAVVARGPRTAALLRGIAKALDRSLLMVPGEEETVWAWLGGRTPLAPDQLVARLTSVVEGDHRLAVGEPGTGLDGWRMSHMQAGAAMPVALRGRRRLVRYADVAILSSVLQDDLLTTSLRTIYLEPLGRSRDGGRSARETLRAYLRARCNVSSAASALGLSRRTVANRLSKIEQTIGLSLELRTAELEAALFIDEIELV